MVVEKLARRGIDPLKILDHQQAGATRRHARQPLAASAEAQFLPEVVPLAIASAGSADSQSRACTRRARHGQPSDVTEKRAQLCNLPLGRDRHGVMPASRRSTFEERMESAASVELRTLVAYDGATPLRCEIADRQCQSRFPNAGSADEKADLAVPLAREQPLLAQLRHFGHIARLSGRERAAFRAANVVTPDRGHSRTNASTLPSIPSND